MAATVLVGPLALYVAQREGGGEEHSGGVLDENTDSWLGCVLLLDVVCTVYIESPRRYRRRRSTPQCRRLLSVRVRM